MGLADNLYVEQNLKQLVEAICALAEGDLKTKTNGVCRSEIDQLLKYLKNLSEKLQPVEKLMQAAASQIPDGIEQLSDVNRKILEATNRILSDAEKVLDNHHAITAPVEGLKAALVAGSSDIARMKKYLEDIDRLLHENKKVLMSLLTALSFQDPVCQRLRKLEAALQDVRFHAVNRSRTFGPRAKENRAASRERVSSTEMESLRSSAISQADVDRILKQQKP